MRRADSPEGEAESHYGYDGELLEDVQSVISNEAVEFSVRTWTRDWVVGSWGESDDG